MLRMLTRQYIYEIFRPVHICLTVKSPWDKWFTVYFIEKFKKKKFKILGSDEGTALR